MNLRTHLAGCLLSVAGLLACTAKPADNPKDVISMSNIPQGSGDLYAIFQTSRGNIVVKLFE